MWQWLLLILVIAGVVAWLYRGPGIVTPVPKHATTIGRRARGDGLWVNLWRAFLLLVIAPIVIAVLFSIGGFFTLTVAGAVLAGLFVPDVRRFVVDTWNANFWRLGG